jgi:phosphonate degradation associated HDIG domain protein
VPIIDRIIQLFHERGDAAYIGEPVSQTEHALQAALAAENANMPAHAVIVALLHDIGHILHQLPEDCAEHGIDDRHEELGCRFLLKHFGPDVCEPVRLHVPAKRFLCAVEPAYLRDLSPASVRSLELQGGPYSAGEAEVFQSASHWADAVAVRRCDDLAKVPGLKTPDFEHYRPYLEKALVTASASDPAGRV